MFGLKKLANGSKGNWQAPYLCFKKWIALFNVCGQQLPLY
jgi:hypothetical protein